jgi:hypothetical protein
LAIPRLIPFRAEHLHALSYRDGDRLETIKQSIRKETMGPAYTAVKDDMILGCAGVVLCWPGMGSAWAVITSDLAKHYPIWLTKTVRLALKDIMRAYNLHRIEMAALEEHARWAVGLGFDYEEFKAKKYTSDKRDVVRLEMISE